MNDFIEKVADKTAIITLIKAGAIPTKDKMLSLKKYANRLFRPRNGRVSALWNVHAAGSRSQPADCAGGNFCGMCHWICCGYSSDHSSRTKGSSGKKGRIVVH